MYQGEQEETAEEIAGLKADKVGLEGKIGTLQQEVQSRTNEMNREIRRKGNSKRRNTTQMLALKTYGLLY